VVGVIKVVALAVGVLVVAASVVGLVVAGSGRLAAHPQEKVAATVPPPNLAPRAQPTGAAPPVHTETATFALG
jgi:hypothetical protein